MPGCSLCMGNQARVEDVATVVSTSTRNFPNRLGNGANVFLASAELASVAAIKGELPTPEEYYTYFETLEATAADTYRYLEFDNLPAYQAEAAKTDESMDKGVYADELKKETDRLASVST